MPATGSSTLSATAATPAARLSRPSPAGCQSRPAPLPRVRRPAAAAGACGRWAATAAGRASDRRQQVGHVPRGLRGRPVRDPVRAVPAAGTRLGSLGATGGGDHARVDAVVDAGRGHLGQSAAARRARGRPSWPASQRARRPGLRVGRQRGGDERQQLRRDPVELRPCPRARGRRSSGRCRCRTAGGRWRRRPPWRPRSARPTRRSTAALDDLGREVARGAHHQAGLGQPGGVRDVRDAEVDDHRLPVVEHDVARLEVAVHHPGRVDGGERLGQPLGERCRAPCRAAGRPGAPCPRASRPGTYLVTMYGDGPLHVGVEHLGDVAGS